MKNVYEGGIAQPVTKLHPSMSSDSASFQPNSGPTSSKVENSGPAESNGSVTKDFLNSSNYRPNGENRPSGMQVASNQPK